MCPQEPFGEHLGPEINYTSRELRCTLDAYIGALANTEVTGLRGMVLGYIVRCTELGGDVYQRDIEAKYHIRRSSGTTLLQGMEAAGLIERCAVAADARLKKLVPTPKGLRCHQKVYAVIDRFEQELQAGITPAERQALVDTLKKLRENLRRMQCAECAEPAPKKQNERNTPL